jgi:tetratricopeptide (TPR) repeat protein
MRTSFITGSSITGSFMTSCAALKLTCCLAVAWMIFSFAPGTFLPGTFISGTFISGAFIPGMFVLVGDSIPTLPPSSWAFIPRMFVLGALPAWADDSAPQRQGQSGPGPGQEALAAKQAGDSYSENGETQKAIDAYKQAIQAYPAYAEVYYLLGLIYDLQEGNLEKAIACYQKFLELVPDSPDARDVRLLIESAKQAQSLAASKGSRASNALSASSASNASSVSSVPSVPSVSNESSTSSSGGPAVAQSASPAPVHPASPAIASPPPAQSVTPASAHPASPAIAQSATLQSSSPSPPPPASEEANARAVSASAASEEANARAVSASAASEEANARIALVPAASKKAGSSDVVRKELKSSDVRNIDKKGKVSLSKSTKPASGSPPSEQFIFRSVDDKVLKYSIKIAVWQREGFIRKFNELALARGSSLTNNISEVRARLREERQKVTEFIDYPKEAEYFLQCKMLNDLLKEWGMDLSQLPQKVDLQKAIPSCEVLNVQEDKKFVQLSLKAKIDTRNFKEQLLKLGYQFTPARIQLQCANLYGESKDRFIDAIQRKTECLKSQSEGIYEIYMPAELFASELSKMTIGTYGIHLDSVDKNKIIFSAEPREK